MGIPSSFSPLAIVLCCVRDRVESPKRVGLVRLADLEREPGPATCPRLYSLSSLAGKRPTSHGKRPTLSSKKNITLSFLQTPVNLPLLKKQQTPYAPWKNTHR